MQTRLQFDQQPSTLREWSDFKGMLNQVNIQKQPFLQGGGNSESLIFHLDRQLKGGTLIVEKGDSAPVFPEKHFLNLVA